MIKGFKRLFAAGLVCVVSVLVFAPMAHSQVLPSANYWGDADGVEILEPSDLYLLYSALGNPTTPPGDLGYGLIGSGDRQVTPYWQDLSGNNIIEPDDLFLLYSWLGNDFSGLDGNPAYLEALDWMPTIDLNTGNSVEIGVHAPSYLGADRAGYGVAYEILPTSTCIGATIYGRDYNGSGVYDYYGDKAFEYTDEPAENGGTGYAMVRVVAPGTCSEGQQIEIRAYIPNGNEFPISQPQRHPYELVAYDYRDDLGTGTEQEIVITIQGGGGGCTPTSVTVTANNPTEGVADTYTLVQNCAEGGTVDVTASSTISDPDCSGGGGNATYNEVCGNDDPPDCTVCDPGSGFCDTIAVVDDGDYITGIVCSISTVTEGTSSALGCLYSWNESGNCNDSDDNADDDAIITGANCAKLGVNGACAEFNCDRTDWVCEISSSKTAVTANYSCLNDDFITAVDLTPNGPVAIGPNQTIPFSGTVIWGGDACSEALCGNEDVSLAETAGCGTGNLNPLTCVYTTPGSDCTDTVSATSYNSITDSTDISVDATPPNSSLDSFPPNPSNSTNPSFSFSSSEPGSTFECQLDGGGWVVCTSPTSYTGLSEGSHTFEVRAIDSVGNPDPTPASYTWSIDITEPVTTIDTFPPNPNNSTDATFTFSSNEPGSTFECRMDGGGWIPCNSPANYTGLGEGDHTFEVRAIDSAGNPDSTPASYTWSIDLTDPLTSIDTFPPDPSNSPDPSFTFSCSEVGCTFECRLDGGGWSSCTSPANYTGLGEGSHTFEVRATDAAGNLDATPASYTWSIDITEPVTTIDTFPPNPNNSTDATFTFSSNEPGSTFECRLDGGGWAVCTSPANYTGLGEGTHTFEVRAIDPAGNPDSTPASYTWTIDTIAPDSNITSFPANPTQSTDASFTFTCNEGACTFECKMDAGGWSACTSPVNYSGLAEGSHTFQVRAIDSALNTDLTPATYLWTIDRTPPDTSITSNPSDPSTSPEASFSFTCTESPSTFECNLDSGGWASCSSPRNYTGLSNASHTFKVRCTDQAGNTDTSPASYTWKVVADSWTSISSTNAPTGRYWHTAVWTGTEMIVWGGNLGGTTSTNTGGRYNPSTDSWTATSTTNAPAARYDHTAVWAEGTVNRMIVWGGNSGSAELNTGAMYAPATDTWTPTSTGPTARYWHSAVWTGTQMIIWGGYPVTNTGARYNPATDSWSATRRQGAPTARSRHTAVWTGTQMIIWGGRDNTTHYNTGGRYNPATDRWTATSTTNVPTARRWQAAVWTGSRMIVWGGRDDTQVFNTGGIYDPSSDIWTTTSTTNAPSPRVWMAWVWTGNIFLTWGGYNLSTALNDGAKYDPVSNSWLSISTTNAPTARYDHTAVWTGTEMILWGGWNGTDIYNDGFKMTPADNWP